MKTEPNSPIEQAKTVARQRYAWPGGYPLALVTTDGGLICPDCVRSEFYQICWSEKNECNDGWRPACLTIVESDETQYCDHCNTEF